MNAAQPEQANRAPEAPQPAGGRGAQAAAAKSKEYIECFFALNRESDEHACNYAECVKKNNRKVKQRLINGYSNLNTHLKVNHPTYVKDFDNRHMQSAKDDDGHFVTVNTSEAKNMCNWLEFLIDNNLPLNSINNRTVRDKVVMEAISSKTAVAVWHRLVRVVEQKIAVEMKNAPVKGIMIDTWGKKHANASFTAIEAVYDCGLDENGVPKEPPLLSMAPLLNEECANADAYIEAIKFVLSCVDLEIADIAFIIADNCATNKSVAQKAGLKFIGCASHRLSLAGKRLMTDDAAIKAVVDKMFSLMQVLKKQKWSTRLRAETALLPADRNETRFNGTADGIKRFFQLKPHMEKIADEELTELMLTPAEVRLLTRNWEGVLEDISVATRILQQRERGQLNLAEVRCILDELMKAHEMLRGSHIDPNHEIVANKALENGMVKILNAQEAAMTHAEKAECKIFLAKPEQPAVNQGERGFASSLKKFDQADCISLQWITRMQALPMRKATGA